MGSPPPFSRHAQIRSLNCRRPSRRGQMMASFVLGINTRRHFRHFRHFLQHQQRQHRRRCRGLPELLNVLRSISHCDLRLLRFNP